MTAGHILFVGEDICARVEVLEHSGYRVSGCACEVNALRDALRQGVFSAVVFQCTPEPPSRLLLSTCRGLTRAPLLLFADRNSPFIARDYDAVIPNLCNPREWLADLETTIATHGKAPQAEVREPTRSQAAGQK